LPPLATVVEVFNSDTVARQFPTLRGDSDYTGVQFDATRMPNMPDISTKPYLLRAIYEWCTDSGHTPYLAVKVDAATTVPMEYVKKGEIILNISYGATSGLKMDNDAVTFRARFNGVSRELYIPVQNVLAIYANENGQGMAFEVNTTAAETAPPAAPPPSLASAPSSVPSSVPSPELAAAPAPGLAAVPAKTAPEVSRLPDGDDEPPKKGGRPTLTRIK
jgi:stringent starvation protein B